MSIGTKAAIEAAIKKLHEHPEEARSADPPATAKRDGILRFRVEGPNGRLVFSDMSKGLGGGASAPSPGWLMRASVASCEATMIALRAAQEGITLEQLEVAVESESDDRGFYGIDDKIPAGPLGMKTKILISSPGTSPERLRNIVNWGIAHSPVTDAMCRAISNEVEVQVS